MPPVLRWLSTDNTCLIVEFKESVTWAEFHSSIQQAHTMIGELPHIVNLIIWDKAGMPDGNPMIHFQRAFREQPANVGMVIVVPTTMGIGMLAFMKRLAIITDKIFPSKSRVKFARSLEEALTLVNSQTPPVDSGKRPER